MKGGDIMKGNEGKTEKLLGKEERLVVGGRGGKGRRKGSWNVLSKHLSRRVVLTSVSVLFPLSCFCVRYYKSSSTYLSINLFILFGHIKVLLHMYLDAKQPL